MSFAASCRKAGVKNNLINAPGADTIIGWTIRMFEYIGTIINSNHLQLVHIRRAKRNMYVAHVHNPMCVCNVACNYSRLKKKISLPVVTSTLSGELFTVLEYPDNGAACYVR